MQKATDQNAAITIELADPRAPEAVALLTASHAYMKSLYPDEWCHVMSADELSGPEVGFYLARVGGVAQGCGALARKDGYGELKSMYVDPAARGTGLGRRLLDHLIALARAEALPCLRLETGDTLAAALSLYETAGFKRCGAFGGYPDVPESVFMELRL